MSVYRAVLLLVAGSVHDSEQSSHNAEQTQGEYKIATYILRTSIIYYCSSMLIRILTALNAWGSFCSI